MLKYSNAKARVIGELLVFGEKTKIIKKEATRRQGILPFVKDVIIDKQS